MERKTISKKLRFEVYKRDNFTCQYCGRKAPDVVLNIDHIVPVSKGGTNDIMNLITSCFECNNGKSNIPLSDESTVNKQRTQLEQLQERREQIEMMFEWKKSLENLDDYTSDLLAEYIESKILPYTLNETGRRGLLALLKRFDIPEIFDAIDRGTETYLKYGKDGQLTKDSVENFISKIGGVAAYQKMPAVDKKMHYIKGICRNRFGYWDDRKGLAILRKYIEALRKQGWTEDRILQDLETEAGDLAKTAKNWSEWRETMEAWISDINSWDRTESDTDISLALDEIEEIANELFAQIPEFLKLIELLTVPFGSSKVDAVAIMQGIQAYINLQVNELLENGDIDQLEPNYQICRKLHVFDEISKFDSEVRRMIEEMFSDYAVKWVSDRLFFPNLELTNAKDALIFRELFNSKLADLILSYKNEASGN